jgi:predicted Zn finger-like uncharacterized protein
MAAEAIVCPSCGGRFTVKNFLRGMRVKCPQCQTNFGAQPAESAAPIAPVTAAAAPPPVARAATRPTRASPPPPPPPVREDEYDLAEELVDLPEQDMATEVAKPAKSRIAPLAYGRRPPAKETTAPSR